MLTGELKKMAIELLQEYVRDFQELRAKVTDEVRVSFMTPRRLEWKGNPNPRKKEAKGKGEGKENKSGAGEDKQVKEEKQSVSDVKA